MKKIIKDNLKKITALLLVVSMATSFDLSAFAEDMIVQEGIAQGVIAEDDINQDESIIVENTLNDAPKVEISNELIEEDYLEEDILEEVCTNGTEADILGSISESDEEARELESMPDSDVYSKKIFTYLSIKYPKIGIKPEIGKGVNDEINVEDDYTLHTWYNEATMKRQTAYETIVIDGKIDGDAMFRDCPDLTKNMVQFRCLGNFGSSIGSGDYGDTVKTLIIRNVDEIRNLSIPASVENLTIENTTLNCYDIPDFQCDRNPGDLKFCENLKTLHIKNVKFGDNYKNQKDVLPELTKNYPYETNYVLNLQNCPNLEELEIDVSFEGAEEVQLSIDGGDENLFEKLSADKCKISPAPGVGYGQIALYANQNSNLSKFYDSSETVKFKSPLFRRWLLKAIGIDTDNDGVISQKEMEAVETLTINNQTARAVEQTSLSDFAELADIAKMTGLKTLELDFYDPTYSSNENRYPLKGIDFPASLENLSMKNIYWSNGSEPKSHENADIILTNLKTLEIYNTDVKVSSDAFDHHTKIVLTDTEGVLQSCIIESTDVESIELINNSNGKGIKDDDEKQRIRFSASECEKLESVEFLGEGYAVEGSLDLSNDKELTHIGVFDNSVWKVYGEFDSTYAPINVTLNSCAKLGSDCSEIVIDYDFINGRDINVQTMNTSFDDAHKLTIKREPKLEAGNVFLSCDDDSEKNRWVYDHYKNEEGFVIEKRTSFPTIAAFTNCQRVHSDGDCGGQEETFTEDTNRWVERWDLVMQPGGYSANFGELKFYVVDDLDGTKSLRRVFYDGDVYVELYNSKNTADSIITLPTTYVVGKGDKLTGTKLSSTGIPGEVQLSLYVYNGDDKSYIGYQNIKVFKMPNSVDLVNDGTKRGSGTKEDPFIVDKDKELKLKARLLLSKEDEKPVVDTASEWALRDIYWRIKEYDESPKYTSDSDGYSLYTLDSATKAGISVVRGELNDGETEAQYDKRVDKDGYNQRRFTFGNGESGTAGTKFKIVAQMPYKNNDTVISKEVYVEYHSEQLLIDVSNDIIHGNGDYDESTITINNVYDKNSVSVSIKNPELYNDCFTVDRDSTVANGKYTWKDIWKLKINSNDIVKVKNIINSNNGAITLVINADGKELEEKIINLSSEYLDVVIDISNDIIHGKKGYGESAITINNVYNINSVNVSIKNPELYDDCFIVERDTSSVDGKEVWKLRINDSDILKVKNIINSNNGLITLVINADGKKYEETIKLSSVYPNKGEFGCEEIEDQIYTGKAIEPKLDIYYGAFLLEEGKDYTLSYSNNVKAASKEDTNTSGKRIGPSVTINGKGNYADKQVYYFSIKPCPIEGTAKVDDITVAKPTGNKTVKVTPVVMLNGKKLKEGTDYVVSTSTSASDIVKPLSEAKIHKLYVVGINNYSGAVPFNFTITEKTLASKVTIKKIVDQKYTGNALTPGLEVTYKIGGKVTDVADNFIVEYKNNTEIGTATAIITAKPESTLFAGSKAVTFKITGEQISKAKLSANGKGTIASKVYDGNPYEPGESNGLTLYYGNESTPLVKDKDYTVTYTNNVNVGTATALVTGKGKYTGTKKLTYKITKYDAGAAPASVISVDGGKDIVVSYEKGGVTPKPTVSMNGVTLTEKRDYTLKYANNKAVAKANAADARGKTIAPAITITFKGNISGQKTVNFEITNKNISECKITIADKAYSTKADAWKQTAVTIADTNGKKLVAGTDYSRTLKYYSDPSCTEEITAETLESNTLVYVKVDGINNYDKSLVGSYRISKNNISKVNALIDPQTFTGSEICPAASEIKVWTGSGNNKTDLVAGQDYDIVPGSYTNNVNKGTATVTITGKGDYYGTKVIKYGIGVNKILWWNW